MSCKPQEYSIRVLLASISTSLHVTLTAIISFFFIDLDPFSLSPVATQLTAIPMINNAKKILIAATPMLPRTLEALIPVSICALHGFHLALKLGMPLSLDNSVNFLKSGSVTLLFASSAGVALQSTLDTGPLDNLGFLYTCLGFLFMAGSVAGYELNKTKRWTRRFGTSVSKGFFSMVTQSRGGMLSQRSRSSWKPGQTGDQSNRYVQGADNSSAENEDIKDLELNWEEDEFGGGRSSNMVNLSTLGFSPQTVVRFIYSMVYLIENCESKIERAGVHSAVKTIYIGIGKKSPKIERLSRKILLMKFEKIEDYKVKNYSLLLLILESMKEIFPKEPYIDLLIAYVAHTKMKLVWVALYKLQSLESGANNVRIVYASNRYIDNIETEIKEREIRRLETSGLDIPYLVRFRESCYNLGTLISKSVELHHQFWTELKERRPLIKKIQNIGSKITENLDKCRKCYQTISQMNPNHFKTLTIFGNFIKFVLNDDDESKKLLDKADYIKRSTNLNNQFLKDKRIKYSENSKFAMVILSGNDEDIGTIKGFNNEFIQKFGFGYDELKNQNISIILPECLRQHHNNFMRRYFKLNRPKVMDSERAVFPMDKNGFILPQSLLIKVVPNLSKGLEVIGLLSNLNIPYDRKADKNSDKDYYILFDHRTGSVLGVSEGCYYEFGIRPDIVEGNSRSSKTLHIYDIFPKRTFDNDGAPTRSGVTNNSKHPRLDTTNLPSQFYIDKSDFIKIGVPKRGKKAFSSYKVKYETSDVESFGTDLRLCLITFKLVDNYQKLNLDSMIKDFAEAKAGEFQNYLSELDEQEDEYQRLLMEQENQKKRMEKYKDDGNMMNRWKREQETNTADRERKIKERKIILGQRRTPATIRILKWSLLFVFLLISFMTYGEAILKQSLVDVITFGQKSLKYLGQKESDIPDITYRVRLLSLLAK